MNKQQTPPPPGMNQPYGPAAMRPAQKKNDNMGAKIVAGVAGGAVVGAAAGIGGAAIVNAQETNGEDFVEIDGTNAHETVNNTEHTHTEHHHHSSHHHHTIHHVNTQNHVDQNIEETGPEVHVESYERVDGMDIARIDVDGTKAGFVDMDLDGEADVLWVDTNNNGIIDDEDYYENIKGGGVQMGELYAANEGYTNVEPNAVGVPVTGPEGELHVVDYGMIANEDGDVIEGAILEKDGTMAGIFDTDLDGEGDMLWVDLNDNKMMDDGDYYENIQGEGIAMNDLQQQYIQEHPDEAYASLSADGGENVSLGFEADGSDVNAEVATDELSYVDEPAVPEVVESVPDPVIDDPVVSGMDDVAMDTPDLGVDPGMDMM